MVEFGGNLISRIKTKMAWHQSRAGYLARNVANAETPGYRPEDLKKISFDKGPASPAHINPVATHSQHIGLERSLRPNFDNEKSQTFEIVKGGNAVSLEVQMAKVTENQLEHEAATVIYQRMLGLFKLANR